MLCLVGKNTGSSDWVNWEIETAYQLNKKIVAVKINRSYDTPIALYGKKSQMGYGFFEKRNYKSLTLKSHKFFEKYLA